MLHRGRSWRRSGWVVGAALALALAPPAPVNAADDAAALSQLLDSTAIAQLKEHKAHYVSVRDFAVNRELKVVAYDLGRVQDGVLGFGESEPERLLFAAAFQFAAWKDFTDDDSAKRAPAEVRAAIAEARKVHEAIVVEYAAASPGGRTESIGRWAEKYRLARKSVVEAIEAYAKANGMSASEISRSPASSAVSVTVKIDPKEGKVKCLPYLKFLLLKQRGGDPKDYPWTALAHDGLAELIGQYQYVAEWTGRPRDEATFFIGGAAMALSFTPGAAPKVD